MPASINQFSFTGSHGTELAARLDLPARKPTAFALFAHCFTCSKDIAAATRIAAGLVDAGLGVLRFDFTGLGSSEGEFANTNFSSNVGDLVAAADAMRERYEAPGLLVGHSLGGTAVLAAAGRIAEVVGVVTIGAPSEPSHVEGVFDAASLTAIERDGEAEVELAGRSFTIRRQFLDDVASHRLDDAIASLDASLLVMHSPVDQEVGVEHARHIYEAGRHPKSFISLDRADHMLTDPADADYVAGVVAAWAGRYLPDAAHLVDEASASGEGEVIVEEAGTGRYTQTVRTAGHHLLADEPIDVGDDAGPNPYEYLLGALGSCTSMTLRMYATRKQIPVERIRVRLSHHRRHCDDCAESGSPSAKVEVIERQIELTGELTEDEIAKLAEIADRCPVHRTITSDLRVDTDVVMV
jgi:uncharacterized OsmC-like protein/alpha/beta superfamily hydrolase